MTWMVVKYPDTEREEMVENDFASQFDAMCCAGSLNQGGDVPHRAVRQLA